MLEEMLNDSCERIDSINSNQPYDSVIDYDQYTLDRSLADQNWAKLCSKERGKYNNKIERYLKDVLPVAVTENLTKSKNLSLIKREAELRIQDPPKMEALPFAPLHLEQSLLELLENLENSDNIRSIYKIRKKNLGHSKNAGLTTKEANRLKNCMRQGRELYQAGKIGNLMVKPLNFFYSLTAYAYAIITLNNPIRYSIDYLPGSHGLIYIRDGLKIQFGGDVPHGTFSELLCSFPTFHHFDKHINFVQSNRNSLLSYFANKFTTSIGNLMSMVPEIREFYSLVTGKRSKTHPLSISMTNNPRNVSWEFQIGDRTTLPSKQSIDNAFPTFQINERHGKTIVIVPTVEAHKIYANIFADAMGMFWFIENPFHPVILPEICIHFLIINAFSNIMRYAPDCWGDILLNNVDSNLSLITRKYIHAFENKFLFFVLRNASSFYPYVG